MKERINSHQKRVFNDFRYDPREQGTPHFQTGVRIYLYQVYLEIGVDHEIVAKQFKTVFNFSRVYLAIDCSEAVSNQLLHLGQQIANEIHLGLLESDVQVTLEIAHAHFVAVFKLSVVFTVLLNRIVSQMDVFVAQLCNVELLARGSKVAIFVEIAFLHPIHRCNKAESPDIKFPPVHQERPFNVPLHNDCPSLPPSLHLLYYLSYFGET